MSCRLSNGLNQEVYKQSAVFTTKNHGQQAMDTSKNYTSKAKDTAVSTVAPKDHDKALNFDSTGPCDHVTKTLNYLPAQVKDTIASYMHTLTEEKASEPHLEPHSLIH